MLEQTRIKWKTKHGYKNYEEQAGVKLNRKEMGEDDGSYKWQKVHYKHILNCERIKKWKMNI